jgi:Zn-dependent protease
MPLLEELIYMVITVLALGYIFMDFFRRPSTEFYHYQKPGWGEFKLSCLAAIPSVVFHELGHKFVAMFFGGTATYFIHPLLFVGVLLKAVGFPFIFFVPAYVSVSGISTAWQYAMTAFAGPAVNLFVWVISWVICRYEIVSGDKYMFFFVLQKLNMWLFIFNMLPLPGTDGFNFINGILGMF